MLFRKRIIENLDFVIQHKMSAQELAEQFQVSKSWVFELLRRRRNNESLERQRSHRTAIFPEKQKQLIRTQYTNLMLTDGKTPSMTVLKECMNLCDNTLPNASLETYRNTVKDMLEYPVKRNKKIYRKRFEAPAVGFMVQGDVTTHAWLENAYPFPLLLFIDDKSRYVIYARFIDSDNIENHKKAVQEWLKAFGKPAIVYYDNDPKYAHGGYIRKLLEKIGVRVINTRPYKPQGKGKLERKNGVFQDQLVHYLKFKEADSVEKSNVVLDWYVDKHNRSYNREIKATPEEIFKNSEDVFQYLSTEDDERLEYDFAVKEKRKVSNINEISINGKQHLVPRLENIPLTGRWVDIIIRNQNWVKVYYKNKFVTQYQWKDIYDS